MSERRRYRENSADDDESDELGVRPGKLPRRADHKDILETIETLMVKLSEYNSSTVQDRINDLSYYVTDTLHMYKLEIMHSLVDCISKHPMQTGNYATFVGLINVRDYEFGGACLRFLMQQLLQSLEKAQWSKARSLMLLLADLVNTNMVTVCSIVSLLNTLVDICEQDESPQKRRDFYAHMVMSSLSLLGRELYEKKDTALQALILRLQLYMKKQRNATETVKLLRIWSNAEMPQHEYLELLWQQIMRLMRDNWMEKQLPRPYLAYDDTLSTALQHKLPALELPQFDESDNIAYPRPYIVVRLFEASDCSPLMRLPDELDIERHVIESQILETLELQHLECKICAEQLLTYCDAKPNVAVEHCIVEVLLGQMLQLPNSPYLTINYGGILLELCKQKPGIFPAVLAQATDMLYTQLESMSVSSFDRFVNWFSHHLSNFRYNWNWQDWENCVTLPQLHPSAMFVREVLKKCMRLSYYQNVVQMIPCSFQALLPAPPAPQFKYIDELLPGAKLAKVLLEAIRAKCAPEVVGGLMEATTDLDDELKMHVLMQTCLHLGSKSFTHVFCIFNKFQHVLKMLANTEANQFAILAAIFELWATNEQLKYVMSDKLMKMQILNTATIIKWIFKPALKEELTKMYQWELIHSTIRYTKNHLHGSSEKLVALLDCLLLHIVESCVKVLADHQSATAQLEVTDYWFDWVLGRLQAVLFDYMDNVCHISGKLRKIASELQHKRLFQMLDSYLSYIQ